MPLAKFLSPHGMTARDVCAPNKRCRCGVPTLFAVAMYLMYQKKRSRLARKSAVK